MTREEAIAVLENCQHEYDEEEAHKKADEVLCDLLTTLGYSDVVAEW